MPTKLQFFENPTAEEMKIPGACWYCPWYVDDRTERLFFLSEYYWSTHRTHRPPIMICLPNGRHWLIDGIGWDGDKPKGGGWKVIGTPPNLTAFPSIGAGDYHGWLKDGVLTP